MSEKILFRIASFLDRGDLLRFSECSKLINFVCCSNSLWQAHFTFHFAHHFHFIQAISYKTQFALCNRRRCAFRRVASLSLTVGLFGAPRTGKSTFLLSFMFNRLPCAYHSTIGAKFGRKIVCLPDATLVQVAMWDVSGHHRYRKLWPSYVAQCNVAAVFFRRNSLKSFDAACELIDRMCADSEPSLLIALIANGGAVCVAPVVPQTRVFEFIERNVVKFNQHRIVPLDWSHTTSSSHQCVETMIEAFQQNEKRLAFAR